MVSAPHAAPPEGPTAAINSSLRTPINPVVPLTALEREQAKNLWRYGHDTLTIASLLGVLEFEVYNTLYASDIEATARLATERDVITAKNNHVPLERLDEFRLLRRKGYKRHEAFVAMGLAT